MIKRMIPRATVTPPPMPGCIIRRLIYYNPIKAHGGVTAALLMEVYQDGTDLLAGREEGTFEPREDGKITRGTFTPELMKWQTKRHLSWRGRRAYRAEVANGKTPLQARQRVIRIGRHGQHQWNAAQGTIRVLETVGAGTVAHECLHAVLSWKRWKYLGEPDTHEKEEEWCYALGDLTAEAVYVLTEAQGKRITR